MKGKCMISQPMNGLSEQEILNARSRAITEIKKLGYEFQDSYFEDMVVPEEATVPVYYLAEAIKRMANCSAVYFCRDWAQHRGCRIEHQIALEYGYHCIYE